MTDTPLTDAHVRQLADGLKHPHWVAFARGLERENADLRAKLARLDGLTNWVCSCGGTDCKGQEENAALREKVDDWENAVLHARDNRSQEQHCTCVPPLIGKVKQLERANAALRAALDAARKEQP